MIWYTDRADPRKWFFFGDVCRFWEIWHVDQPVKRLISHSQSMPFPGVPVKDLGYVRCRTIHWLATDPTWFLIGKDLKCVRTQATIYVRSWLMRVSTLDSAEATTNPVTRICVLGGTTLAILLLECHTINADKPLRT